MKAIVQEAYGGAEVLHLRDIDPPPVRDDDILVRVRCASVNALDWHLTHGLPPLGPLIFGARQPRDRVRGVDLAGSVEAVGPKVSGFAPGDAVFGTGKGSFAELAISNARHLARKPARLSFEEAASLPVAGLTALQGLRDTARLRPGQRVLVYGAGGGVGTFAVQIAKALGAHVTAVTNSVNLERLRSLGADTVIDYTAEDFAARGERYDVFFDIGSNRSLADCRRVLQRKGVLVLAGAAPGGGLAPFVRPMKALFASPFVSQRLAPLLCRTRPEDLEVLADLVESGKLHCVITQRFPLDAAAAAVGAVGTSKVLGKVVIQVAA